MKRSILSIILLALMISLTVTVGSANLITAYAIENYLQLRSANVDYHGGDIDVDIRTGGNIPSESGNNGFGYAVLTDVGDESVDNVLVAISDIGLKNNDKSTKNDKLHTYVLDLTGDTSKDCSGSDYEVTKSSSDNEGFDTSYPIDVEGNKISIDDVDTNDLASGTVKAIASFTAEAITNNGKIKQICIDIQDVLKQSEIGVSYNNDDNDNNGNGDDEDDHNDNDDKRRHDREHDREQDDCDIGDAGFPFCDGRGEEEEEDGDDSTGIDIDQDIDQSNECGGSSTCTNEGNNVANVGGDSSSSSNSDGFELDIDQNIDQSNTCGGEAECSNEGRNEANIWEDIGSGADIGQNIEQSNECGGKASCSNEASNEANVFGYPSAADDEEFEFDSGVDISQSIEQSNTCGGSATCSNIASNIANIG
ncbi:MAG: hypothetical protein K0S91_2383 [Nitrososphaeraceae archaeon]|nr:hypothetical protein [Nitrososphaeraceae archaeon]